MTNLIERARGLSNRLGWLLSEMDTEPAIQAAALADAVSTWVSRFPTGEREGAFNDWIEFVRVLIPERDREMEWWRHAPAKYAWDLQRRQALIDAKAQELINAQASADSSK